MQISGVIAPVPTPFAADGRPDPEALERHLQQLARWGADGVLVLGTTGEFASLSLEERLAVAGSAARARGGLRAILGVGSCALPEVLATVGAAVELGYDAVLLPPPFYYPASEEGIVTFLSTVLDAAELPVLLYHTPQVTGVPITDRILDRLWGHPQLVGIKDSTGSLEELRRLAPRFAGKGYFVGSDRLVAASRAAGGVGVITAASNIAPRLVREAWEDPRRQQALTKLRQRLESHGTIATVKAVLAARGLMEPHVRPPLSPAPLHAVWELETLSQV